jgi:hypothetical protein
MKVLKMLPEERHMKNPVALSVLVHMYGSGDINIFGTASLLINMNVSLWP